MKNSLIIKSAGYTTIRINAGLYKGLFGGNCNHVIGLFNEEGEILCIEGKPYFPIGRISAFASLISSGDIKNLEFKKFQF